MTHAWQAENFTGETLIGKFGICMSSCHYRMMTPFLCATVVMTFRAVIVYPVVKKTSNIMKKFTDSIGC